MLVEIDPLQLVLQSDSFVANGIELTVIGPGDTVDLTSGHIERSGRAAAAAALLDRLVAGLAREGSGIPAGTDAGAPRGLQVSVRRAAAATAVLDLECARDENA